MTRAKNNPLPDAAELFRQHLSATNQHLIRPDEPVRNLTVFSRYWTTDQARPERCPVCLRIYDAEPARPGGQPYGYCTPACRSWAADTRRRSQPRQWRRCEECDTDLFALEDRPACPPAAPASYWGQSDCRRQRKLRLDAEACRRYRQRAALAPAGA